MFMDSVRWAKGSRQRQDWGYQWPHHDEYTVGGLKYVGSSAKKQIDF